MKIVPPSSKRVVYVVQYETSAAFQNVEGFVHLKVPVNRSVGASLAGCLMPDCRNRLPSRP